MIDIEEMKKLPAEEKWKIINELEASMDTDDTQQDDEGVDESLLQEMEQRYHDVREGKMQTISWEEAEKILLKQIENRTIKHA